MSMPDRDRIEAKPRTPITFFHSVFRRLSLSWELLLIAKSSRPSKGAIRTVSACAKMISWTGDVVNVA